MTLLTDRICVCGCGRELPKSKPFGSAYYGRTCRNRVYYERRLVRLVGWNHLCVDCAHPEDFHNIPRTESNESQMVLEDLPANMQCSQFNCKCQGHVKQLSDVEWNTYE